MVSAAGRSPPAGYQPTLEVFKSAELGRSWAGAAWGQGLPQLHRRLGAADHMCVHRMWCHAPAPPPPGTLRREMNNTDQVKSARATDALLNYETVKVGR